MLSPSCLAIALLLEWIIQLLSIFLPKYIIKYKMPFSEIPSIALGVLKKKFKYRVMMSFDISEEIYNAGLQKKFKW